MIDSSSEVNAITPTYISKLGFKVHFTDVEAQKIDDSNLKTFGMILASFQMVNKLEKAQFFQETFLLADINLKIVLSILFFTFSHADIRFIEKEFT